MQEFDIDASGFTLACTSGSPRVGYRTNEAPDFDTRAISGNGIEDRQRQLDKPTHTVSPCKVMLTSLR